MNRKEPSRRTLRRMLTLTGAVAVLLIGAVTTAPVAQAGPYWQPYKFSSAYTCGPTSGSQSVYYQTCIINRPGSRWVQAALLVWNKAGTHPRTIEAPYIGVPGTRSSAYCLESAVGSEQRTACFSNSVEIHETSCATVSAEGWLRINGGEARPSYSPYLSFGCWV